MKTSKEGRVFIEKHEGRRNSVYTCPAGHKTIGIGHKLTAREIEQKFIEISMPKWNRTYQIDWRFRISDIEIECLLSQDLRHFEFFVNTFIASCNPGMIQHQHQFDALISFYFNIGTDAGRNSDSYDLLRRRRLADAMDIAIQWHNVKGKLNMGLLNRRMEEIELFMGDEYDREYWERRKERIIAESNNKGI
jgi:GH24 family phage-related lysozyme (muramidase)